MSSEAIQPSELADRVIAAQRAGFDWFCLRCNEGYRGGRGECPRCDTTPPAPPVSRDAVWLIERSQIEGQDPPCWWAGEGNGEWGPWTPTAYNAIRYPSRETAQLALNETYAGAFLGHEATAHVCEHVFIDAARSAPAAGAPKSASHDSLDDRIASEDAGDECPTCGAGQHAERDAQRYHILLPHLTAEADDDGVDIGLTHISFPDERSIPLDTTDPVINGLNDSVEIIGISTNDVGKALDFVFEQKTGLAAPASEAPPAAPSEDTAHG